MVSKVTFINSVFEKKVLLYGTLSMLIIQCIFLYRFNTDKHFQLSYFLTSMIALSVISLLALKINKMLLTSLLSCVSGIVSCVILIWAFGGLRAPGVQWLCVFPIVLGSFFGRRSFVLSMLAIGFAFLFFDQMGESPIVLSSQKYQFEKNLNLVFLCIFTTVIVYAFLDSIEHYQAKLSKQRDVNDKLLRVLLHDISNPLTVIGFVSKKINKEEETKLTKKLDVNYRAIQQILNDMKVLNKYSQTDESLFVEVVSAKEILIDVLNVFEDVAKRKKVNLLIESFISEDSLLKTNIGLLKSQVLYNLISNAIKFTPANHSVTVRAFEVGQRIYFEVKDEGEGIESSMIDELFNTFKSVSCEGTDGEAGSGHGLSLVVYFLKRLKGEFEVLTKDNEYSITKGTAIRVSFEVYGD